MPNKKSAWFSALILGAILLSACAGGAAQPPAASASNSTDLPAGSVQINGAGATFPLPVYTEWTYAYQYVDPSVVLNYQGIGSGGGKKAIVDRTVDFAGSDSLLKDEEYQAGGDLQMVPMLAGAVVPIYNLEGLTDDDPLLVLDRETLANIYLAKITKWNDPAIVALNPGLAGKLPDASISAVSRDVFLAIPNTQREAAYALGATQWETIRQILLPYGLSGILGAVILGFGRALGETMAVTMVIGNSIEGSLSILRPGYTMSSIIANEFAEAVTQLHTEALVEVGLVLFVLTLLLNMIARFLVWREARKTPQEARA